MLRPDDGIALLLDSANDDETIRLLLDLLVFYKLKTHYSKLFPR